MKRIYALTLLILVAACSDSGANVQPILDGPPSAAFSSDLSACRQLARDQKQFDQETAGAAVLGAGIGALLGAADDDGEALGGAVVGAMAGGLSGAVNASERREAIVLECLKVRGHKVVGS